MKHLLSLIIISVTCITSVTATSSSDCSLFCSESKSCDRSSSCSEDCTPLANTPVVTHLHFRSQGANTARELVGWQWNINLPYMCQPYGASYLAFEYTRSFKEKQITKALFGGSQLFFAGSLVPDRLPDELVAENFGLSRTFRGSLKICPHIENFILDFGFYMGLDCWRQGFYFRLHAPFVHTRWDLGLKTDCCDVICTTTSAQPPFDPCFISSTTASTIPEAITGGQIVTPRAVDTFASAVTNVEPAQTLEQALSGGFTGGDIKNGWCAGRFDFGRRTRNAVADIDLIFGYNWLNTDCFHVGTFVQAVIPTGARARSEFIFDPVIGNGGHFELGGGISAHWVMLNNPCWRLGVFLEGNVTHLFTSRQCRLFDFCSNGAFSRYLLLKEFENTGSGFVYTGRLVSATCFNNRAAKVSIDVKGDASLKFSYQRANLGIDIGYNVYGHTAEKICLIPEPCCCDIKNRAFGIKGTEAVCCFSYPIVNVTTTGTPPQVTIPTVFPAGTVLPTIGAREEVPQGCPDLNLSAPLVVTVQPNNNTQSGVTAFSVVAPQPGFIAPHACQVCLAPESAQVTTETPVSALTPANGFIVANSTQPTFVDVRDLDSNSGQAWSVLTHKVFTHISYAWPCECWQPSVGIGAEVEFNGRKKNCDYATLNQWGIWFKSTVAF